MARCRLGRIGRCRLQVEAMDKVTKRKPTGAAAKGAGPGRPKGSQNKVTKQLKDMILGALDAAGGQKYLEERARDPRTSAAFLTLLGKVLPSEIKAEHSGPDGKPLPAAAPVFNVTVKG